MALPAVAAAALKKYVVSALARKASKDGRGSGCLGVLAVALIAFAIPLALIFMNVVGPASKPNCGTGDTEGAAPGTIDAPGSLGGVAGTGITQSEYKKSQIGSKKFTPGTYESTAYPPSVGGINGGPLTATGISTVTKAGIGRRRMYEVAVDRDFISLGQLVYIWPNPYRWRGPFLVADVGSKASTAFMLGRRIDFYIWGDPDPALKQANAWGRRNVKVSAKPIVGGADYQTANGGGATTQTAGKSSDPGSIGSGKGSVKLLNGVNMTHGSEPKILAALKKLSAMMGKTIYVISGYRSPSHSVSIGGFANDPHTSGKAADIGVGNALRASASQLKDDQLEAVGLRRPYYPQSAKEINHVELTAAGEQGTTTDSGADSEGSSDPEQCEPPCPPDGNGSQSDSNQGVLPSDVPQELNVIFSQAARDQDIDAALLASAYYMLAPQSAGADWLDPERKKHAFGSKSTIKTKADLQEAAKKAAETLAAALKKKGTKPESVVAKFLKAENAKATKQQLDQAANLFQDLKSRSTAVAKQTDSVCGPGGDAGPADIAKVRKVTTPGKMIALPKWATAKGYAGPAIRNGHAIVDSRVAPAFLWMLKRYNLRVHDCLASGHNTHGTGDSCDIVPAEDPLPQPNKMRKGWDRVEKMARDFGWKDPKVNSGGMGCSSGAPFRGGIAIICYNGDLNHGDPKRFYGASCNCPHIHITFANSVHGAPTAMSTPPGWVTVFQVGSGGAAKQSAAVGFLSILLMTWWRQRRCPRYLSRRLRSSRGRR